MKYLIQLSLAFLFCLSFNSGSAQYTPQFTTEEYTAFGQIFNQSNAEISKLKVDYEFKFDQLGISKERYREILENRSNGIDDVLNDKELLLLDFIKDEHQRVIDEREIIVRTTCESKGLSAERYYSMLLKYKTNKEFQNTIEPYLKTNN